MFTCIEELPSELWLMIFRFLTPEHIVLAFSELNSFFNSILASSHLRTIFRVKIDRRDRHPGINSVVSWKNLKFEWIQALDTSEFIQRGCIVQFVRYQAPRLINLRSLNIYIRAKQAAFNLAHICKALPHLCSLQVFKLNCTGGPVDKKLTSNSIAELFKNILQSSSLRHCMLQFWKLAEQNFDYKSLTYLPINHSIEYLNINNIDRIILFNLLSYCHGLKSLIAERNEHEDMFSQENNYYSMQSLSLTALSTIKLSVCNLTFAELKHICTATTRRLRHLQLTYSVYIYTNHYKDYLDYFDQKRWTNLLEDRETINVSIKIYPLDDVAKDIVGNMTRMNSSFTWTENRNSPSYACLTIKKTN